MSAVARRWRLGVGIALVTVAAGLLLTPVRVLVGALLARGLWAASEHRMRDPAVFVPISEELARRCNTAPALVPHRHMGDGWLPPHTRELGTTMVTIAPDAASVSMGGGFHHWGYSLLRTADPAPGRHAWVLYFSSEDAEPEQVVLRRFETNAGAGVSPAEFLKTSLAGYDAEIARGRVEASHDKVAFLAEFGAPAAARAALEAARDALPDDPWAHVLAARVASTLGDPDRAGRELAAWASARPSYSRDVELASFFVWQKRPVEAEAASDRAIAHPIVELPEDHYNTEFRGLRLAVALAELGRFDGAIRLIDALAPVSSNGATFKAPSRALRDACVRAKAGASFERPEMSELVADDAFAAVDWDRLVAR